MLKNLNIKRKKNKNKTKLKNIVITNANNTFEIPVLKMRNRPPGTNRN